MTAAAASGGKPGAGHLHYGGWVGTEGVCDSRPLNPYMRLDKTLTTPAGAAPFTCPCDDNVPGEEGSCVNYFGTSYATNIMLIGQNKLASRPPSYLKTLYAEINRRMPTLRLSQIDQWSKLVLIGDYGWVNQWMPQCTIRTEWHGKPACHNVAYLDTHAEFLKVRKGIFVSDHYRVLPFEDLDKLALSCQKEEP